MLTDLEEGLRFRSLSLRHVQEVGLRVGPHQAPKLIYG